MSYSQFAAANRARCLRLARLRGMRGVEPARGLQRRAGELTARGEHRRFAKTTLFANSTGIKKHENAFFYTHFAFRPHPEPGTTSRRTRWNQRAPEVVPLLSGPILQNVHFTRNHSFGKQNWISRWELVFFAFQLHRAAEAT